MSMVRGGEHVVRVVAHRDGVRVPAQKGAARSSSVALMVAGRVVRAGHVVALRGVPIRVLSVLSRGESMVYLPLSAGDPAKPERHRECSQASWEYVRKHAVWLDEPVGAGAAQ